MQLNLLGRWHSFSSGMTLAISATLQGCPMCRHTWPTHSIFWVSIWGGGLLASLFLFWFLLTLCLFWERERERERKGGWSWLFMLVGRIWKEVERGKCITKVHCLKGTLNKNKLIFKKLTIQMYIVLFLPTNFSASLSLGVLSFPTSLPHPPTMSPGPCCLVSGVSCVR